VQAADQGDGKEGPVTPDQAREFVANNHRAVMITRRSAGGLQTSPVTVGIDSDGKVVISSRETAYKVRNLRRQPTATLCVFSLATPDDAVQRRLANSLRRAMPPTA
jgi:Pyridoxamine 5'-phosphate oxidase